MYCLKNKMSNTYKPPDPIYWLTILVTKKVMWDTYAFYLSNFHAYMT